MDSVYRLKEDEDIMLFHPEKKVQKLIDTAESSHLCYYEFDDDDHGPSLMKCVKLLQREGLRRFWFSSDPGSEIEDLGQVPVVDAYFVCGLFCVVHLIGTLEQIEHDEDTDSCLVRFVAMECRLHTGVREKNIPIQE